jgi:hypothetical protein
VAVAEFEGVKAYALHDPKPGIVPPRHPTPPGSASLMEHAAPAPAWGNDNERRTNLRRLDDILEALERLNLRDATELPPGVRERLEHEGIPVESGVTFTRLIELVWGAQERYLIDLKADRRKGSRRSREGSLPPRVLDDFLSRLNLRRRSR